MCLDFQVALLVLHALNLLCRSLLRLLHLHFHLLLLDDLQIFAPLTIVVGLRLVAEVQMVYGRVRRCADQAERLILALQHCYVLVLANRRHIAVTRRLNVGCALIVLGRRRAVIVPTWYGLRRLDLVHLVSSLVCAETGQIPVVHFGIVLRCLHDLLNAELLRGTLGG